MKKCVLKKNLDEYEYSLQCVKKKYFTEEMYK